MLGLKKPRYIDIEKCSGCGDCAKVCPVTVPSAFDEGLGSASGGITDIFPRLFRPSTPLRSWTGPRA